VSERTNAVPFNATVRTSLKLLNRFQLSLERKSTLKDEE